LLTNFSKTTVT